MPDRCRSRRRDSRCPPRARRSEQSGTERRGSRCVRALRFRCPRSARALTCGAEAPDTRAQRERNPILARDPASRPYDGSRTRVEATVAFPSVEDEVATPTRRFTVREITSGLPDDSREEDEREGERRPRDLRGWVERARAVVTSTPGLEETLAGDWSKAARLYVKFGVHARAITIPPRARSRGPSGRPMCRIQGEPASPAR